jgi:hypothetical protein
MDILNLKLLEKLKRKNKGNVALIAAIDLLISDLKSNKLSSQTDLLNVRPDADCVHGDGFLLFGHSHSWNASLDRI